MNDLEFELDSLDGLEEKTAGYYSEHNGKFRLRVSGLDPLDELKGALSKERIETKRLKGKISGLKNVEDASDFKVLYENGLVELQEAKSNHDSFVTQTNSESIARHALSIAKSLSKNDDSKRDLLSEKISEYVAIENGKVVLKLDGVEVDSSKIKDKVIGQFPYLCDGNQSSGGGAIGNSSGGAGSSAIMSREDFNNKSQAERAKFFSAGGRLIQ